jgi:plasmid maintenance system antidote protein VapI
MNTVQYLNAAKRKLEISSDYALAKRLGITKASISLLVNGRSVMSNTTAAKIAEILELDPLRVIADMELERGTNDELWRRIARKVAGVVLPVAIAGSIAAPSPAGASADRPHAALHSEGLRIMSNHVPPGIRPGSRHSLAPALLNKSCSAASRRSIAILNAVSLCGPLIAVSASA